MSAFENKITKLHHRPLLWAWSGCGHVVIATHKDTVFFGQDHEMVTLLLLTRVQGRDHRMPEDGCGSDTCRAVFEAAASLL